MSLLKSLWISSLQCFMGTALISAFMGLFYLLMRWCIFCRNWDHGGLKGFLLLVSPVLVLIWIIVVITNMKEGK
jgi:hypothetical protein